MSWYERTYACGHPGRENITGPTRNREWIAERRFSGLCPECAEKERLEKIEAENKKATELSQEYELPELIGSEKQVSWANTLRLKRLEEFEEVDKIIADGGEWVGESSLIHYFTKEEIEALSAQEDVETAYQRLRAVMAEIYEYLMSQKTKASWWIDTRQKRLEDILEAVVTDFKEYASIQKDPVKRDIIAEATLFPEEKRKNGIVKIAVLDNKITAEYEKDEEFRKIVKSQRFKWDDKWIRFINVMTGKAEDRAAELGNQLLREGFVVQIIDEEAREKAITGNFEPEYDRWICNGSEGKVEIIWEGKNDKLYQDARSIKGARYSRGAVIVPVDQYQALLDFADLYNFRITPKAREKLNAYLDLRESALKVKPGEPEDFVYTDDLESILNTSREILDDLRDE